MPVGPVRVRRAVLVAAAAARIAIDAAHEPGGVEARGGRTEVSGTGGEDRGTVVRGVGRYTHRARRRSVTEVDDDRPRWRTGRRGRARSRAGRRRGDGDHN